VENIPQREPASVEKEPGHELVGSDFVLKPEVYSRAFTEYLSLSYNERFAVPRKYHI